MLVVLLAALGSVVPLAAIGGERDQRAMGPAEAITRARAHLDAAEDAADAQAAWQRRLEAATTLRHGILGLRGDDHLTVEHLVPLYRLYVLALSRLEMRHHAATAALAGIRQALCLIERFRQQGMQNPWMRATADGRIAWNHDDVTPVRLATDGLIIASQLKARDPGMNGIHHVMLDRLSRLDPPSCAGSNLSRSHILALVAEEDHEAVLRESAHLLRERPDQDLWVWAVRNAAIPAWAQRLRREGDTNRADVLLVGLAQDNAVMFDKVREELARPDLPPARREEAERMMRRIGVTGPEALPGPMP